MSKTIEEAAREYAEYRTKGGAEYDSKTEYHQDRAIYYDEAMAVLPWLFAQPLSERLTEEEKMMIRNEYERTYPDDIDCGIENIMVRAALERIFGKEMFEKDGE